jgi:hypothetical protein
MANAKKDAGEARQRPRPRTPIVPQATVGAPTARPAGIAPAFAAGAAPGAVEGAHKGMITNPWVKHWAGVGPAPTTTRPAGRQPRPAAQTKAAEKSKAAAKPSGTPKRK